MSKNIQTGVKTFDNLLLKREKFSGYKAFGAIWNRFVGPLIEGVRGMNMKTIFSSNNLSLILFLGTFLLMSLPVFGQDSRVRTESEDIMLELTRVANTFKGAEINSKDVAKFVPTDMEAGTSDSQIMAKMADKGIQTWFNSESVQNSVVGQTATAVQKNMSLDAQVKTKEVEHKFTMNFLAIQASAKFEYTGYLNATVFHSAGAQQTDVQLSEKVFSNKKLYVNHSMKPTANLSTLGVSWNF